MIRLYDANERYFTNNGIKSIKPLKAVIYKEDNGDYYLELEASLEYVDFIKQDMILRVDTPWGKQGFRCINPTTTHNKIKVKAWHLFYDSERYTINNSYVDGYNCAYALDHLNNACDQTTPFSTSSDITTMASCRVVRKSLAEGVKHIVEVWGGHLYRDNWNIAVRSNIGQDRGVTLAYGKNIKQLEAEENWDVVCTKILPVGNDGVTLDEIYLESELQYDVPYTRVIPFDQDIEQGEEMSDEEYKALLKADLKIQAEAYLENHLLPEVNYTLKAHLTNVADIGDTIFVKHPKCNIDIETHVISVQWDVIKGQYKEIEFGNFKQTLSGLKDKIESDLKDTVNDSIGKSESFVLDELRKATAEIKGMTGKSHIIYDNDKMIILDKLPKEEARNCMLFNSGGIGFSQEGIDGTFNSAWLIDGTLDMSKINVINLKADFISSGTLDADKITVNGLEVGKNVKMGEKAVISWENINGKPEIPSDEKITKITKNTILTESLTATDLTITGGKVDITAADGDAVIVFSDDACTTEIYTRGMIVTQSGTNKQTKINQNAVSADSIWGNAIIENGEYISNKYAPKSHSHSGYASSSHAHSGSDINGGYPSVNSVYLNSPGSASVQALYRSTNSGIIGISSSSRRYKNSIEEVKEDYLLPERLYDLPVVQYKWNKGHFNNEEHFDYNTIEIGFIAEDVAKIYPRAAVITDGQVESWEVRNLIPPMIKLIQDQKNEIDELKERLDRIEQRLSDVEKNVTSEVINCGTA